MINSKNKNNSIQWFIKFKKVCKKFCIVIIIEIIKQINLINVYDHGLLGIYSIITFLQRPFKNDNISVLS